MITQIFSVYDSKTAAYLPPFYMVSKPAAIRAITDAVTDQEHMFFKHAEDYALFFLGSWADDTAKYDLLETPMHLCALHELKHQE